MSEELWEELERLEQRVMVLERKMRDRERCAGASPASLFDETIVLDTPFGAMTAGEFFCSLSKGIEESLATTIVIAAVKYELALREMRREVGVIYLETPKDKPAESPEIYFVYSMFHWWRNELGAPRQGDMISENKLTTELAKGPWRMEKGPWRMERA